MSLTTFTSTVHGIRVLLADERERKEREEREAEREAEEERLHSIRRLRAAAADYERQAANYACGVASLLDAGRHATAAILDGKRSDAAERARSCRESLARLESANGGGAKGGAL